MDRKTILVVNDNEGIRDMLGELLIMRGYDPIICEDGEHAIPYISEVDLLITDFNMSGMDGIELTKMAKQQKPGMPVIIITGAPEDIPVGHLADQVIEKPFDIGHLKKVIADLLQ